MTDQLRLGESEATLRPPRVVFLQGLLATWLAGDKQPTKAQRELAECAALAAVDVLNSHG